MDWFERYREQLEELAMPEGFAEELRVAAEDFFVQCFRAELELWAMTDPDNLMGR